MGRPQTNVITRRKRGSAVLMAWCAIFVALSVGCTSGDDDAAATSVTARAGSFGVVEVERRFDPTGSPSDAADTVESSQAVLGAVFARYEGVAGQRVLDLLGVARAESGIDRCAVAGAEQASLPDPSAAVELVDVGTIDVEVGGQRTDLAARTFPELGRLVAGVFYAESTELPVAIPDHDEYRIRAEGSDAVAPFSVVAVAPPVPAGLAVDGQPLDGLALPLVERDRELEMLWDAGDPRDRVELQLTAGGQLLECSARDDGAFRIPAHLLAELDADPEARLVVRRVRAQPFDAPGVDVAWVDVVSTRTGALRVR